MRKYFYYFMCIGVISFGSGLNSVAQETQVDSAQVEKLIRSLDEKNYTRIPNKDFDDIMTYKISNGISEKLTFWLAVLLGLITIIGGLVLYTSKKFIAETIRNQIEDKFKLIENNLSKLNEEQIKGIKEQIVTDLKRIDSEIERMNHTSLSTQKFIFGEEFEKIRGLDDTLHGKQKYDRLKNLLAEIEKIGYNELLSNVINELALICYNLRYDREIIQIIDKYSADDRLELPSSVYIIAGLVGFNNYSQFSALSGKSDALKYLNKALEITPGFGSAQALKLEIAMMDYEKAATESEKDEAINTAAKIINEINNSWITPSETIARLNLDREAAGTRAYVEKLYSLFPAEMAVMEDKAYQTNELAQSTKDLKNLSEDDISKLNSLLTKVKEETSKEKI